MLTGAEFGPLCSRCGRRARPWTWVPAKKRGWRAIDLLANPVNFGTVSTGAVGISWMPEDNSS
ncbi:hypothetical protein AWC25_01850 [Mycobacterium sherrisii]|uniref:Uncharacterized protein n=1 Tax=Mycobacterium sherrisii TaxID=243061 RepID=A0A1E3SVH1_9MYCO|nr:hypothetical protein BHQ21_13775 [Mycobacterium sherrisii]ORW82668.1 hypothetical protein AWC25_01850 [Mycobacterium sherrisii]